MEERQQQKTKITTTNLREVFNAIYRKGIDYDGEEEYHSNDDDVDCFCDDD